VATVVLAGDLHLGTVGDVILSLPEFSLPKAPLREVVTFDSQRKNFSPGSVVFEHLGFRMKEDLVDRTPRVLRISSALLKTRFAESMSTYCRLDGIT
jgi:hypothetical protein